MKHHHKLFEIALFGTVVAGAILVVAFLSWQRSAERAEPQQFGVTYSVIFAEQLGLDGREVWTALLDELQIKKFRVPVYWSLVESEQGEFDWSYYDWLLDEAEKREGVEITLVIGRKVPRWPECFIPDWVDLLPDREQDQAVLSEVRQAVMHFKDRFSVTRWQVENEPFLAFGECPHPSLSLLQQELAVVRSLDDRPIQMTTSGEQEPWIDTAINADIVGVSLYRLVWSDVFGFAFYPFGPGFYRARAEMIAPLVDEVIVSELQAEPWFTGPIDEIPIAEQYQSFDVESMLANVRFSERTGMSES
ncbi:MAG: hypothetical protein ABIG32_03845, partial [Candidatus Uhrbacteria bacterium]